MTTLTPSLSLTLYDNGSDASLTFNAFRTDIAGTAFTSNFYKIDTAYGTLESTSSTHTSQLTSLLGGKTAIYVQSAFVSTGVYTATGIANVSSYLTGMLIILSVDTTITGSTTLNINSLGAKSLSKLNSSGAIVPLSGSDLLINKYYLFVYDGTQFVWVGANSADQLYIAGTSGNVVTVNTDNSLVGNTTQSLLISQTTNSSTNKATPADADKIGIIDSAASNVLKHTTWSNIKTALNSLYVWATVTHAATAKTTPADADEFSITDSAASFVIKSFTYLSLKLAIWAGIKPAEGQVLNGKISVTVAANNITVALKTMTGGNPSATDPVYVVIGGTLRTVTAALSVTKNAGTVWFNSGSSELATLEVDYFVYLIWNTTPATDIVDIGFARVPYFSVYSEASGTSTSEKYLAFGNASTPTSTDSMVNIGRFAATLSAGAGYTWSVPTFTSANLIQYPIYESRFLYWNPTMTGFSSNPPSAIYKYFISRKIVNVLISQDTAGASNAGGFTLSLPFTNETLTGQTRYGLSRVVDNSAALSAPGRASLASGSNTVTFTTTWNGAAFTASGNKSAHLSDFIYPVVA